MLLKILLFTLYLGTIAAAQAKPERVVNEVPSHVPIGIEVLVEGPAPKQDAVRIEITNRGDKPVYNLVLYFYRPVESDGSNVKWGHYTGRFFGSHRLMDVRRRATDGDEAIRPGESITFRFREGEVRQIIEHISENVTMERPRIVMRLRSLSYGDGTGFVSHDGQKYPRKNNKVLNVKR